MKKIKASFILSALLLALSSCAFDSQSDNYFGFSKQIFTVVEEQETHEGWLGDGSYYLVLDCVNNPDAALCIVSNWKRLPLSENLNRIMYTHSGFNLSEEAHMPVIENGYYYFEDRHAEATDSTDDSELFSRYSYNFSLAVYDTDTNRFYYFEFDT